MSNVNVFAVDVTPGGYPNGMINVPIAAGNVPVRITSPSWGPNQIAQEIVRAIPANSRIDTLHLAAHGNSGQLFIGSGLNVGNARALQPLAGKVAGMVRIHGCAVASAIGIDNGCVDRSNPARPVNRTICMPSLGTAAAPAGGWVLADDVAARIRRSPGYLFLAAMAATLRARVQGAIQAQDADRVGSNNWSVQGARLTVWPGGGGSLYDPHANSGVGDEQGAVYRF